MEEKEFEALVAKVGDEAARVVKTKMDEAQKLMDEKYQKVVDGTATKEEIAECKSDMQKINSDLLETIKKQSEAINNLQKKGVKEQAKTLKQSLLNAYAEKQEEIDTIVKSGQTIPLKITVDKAAVDMGTDNTIGAGATQYSLIDNTGIISPIRRREEKYLQSVSVGSLTNARALWIEETDEQGTPIFIGEGDAKIKLSSLWVEKTAETKKIGVYGKVTTEMLADLPQLVSYIENSLMKRLSVATETQLLVGLGTGDTLTGAKTYATAFSAGANAGLIPNSTSNEWDVLDAIALQVEVAHGVPNAVYINPSTWSLMKSRKDSTGQPIWKAYMDNYGNVIYAGMKVITSTAVTAGEFIGGDMSVLNVLFRERMSVQIGLDGNDFTNNKKTILVEQRLVQFASANDTPVLVKGTFAAAKTALEAAS